MLLNRTRIGTAMRAAVDNRELLELFGASANRVSMLSWAAGSMLAGLGGVLLAAYVSPLDYYQLTFLVIASFAAAMLGRLSSLPLTFAGAIALGLGSSYVQNYVHGSAYIQTGLQSSLPTFLLFATVMFVPQVRLRVGQVKGILAANVPSGAAQPHVRRRADRRRPDRAAAAGPDGHDPAAGSASAIARRDAVAGPADRVRRLRLAGAVHLRRRRRGGGRAR